jgi:hypothetical protein
MIAPPVKLGGVSVADLVGPTGVAVGLDPELNAPPVESVLLDRGAGDPVEPLPMPVPRAAEDAAVELLPVLRVTEDKVLEEQEGNVHVVVDRTVEVKVMKSLLELDMTEEVEAGLDNTDEAEVKLDKTEELELEAAVEVERNVDEAEVLVAMLLEGVAVGVQSGRVKVPLAFPELP